MADGFLLEDGSGRYLLEDGSGVYLNEVQPTAYTIEVTPGALPIAGSSVTMRYGKTAGTHVAAALPIVGVAVAPVFNKTISVTPAAIPIAGATVTPVFTPGRTDYEITVTPGSIPIAGVPVAPIFAKTITVSPASLPIVGEQSSPVHARAISVTPASLDITGSAAAPIFARSLSIVPASLSIAGASLDLVADIAPFVSATRRQGSSRKHRDRGHEPRITEEFIEELRQAREAREAAEIAKEAAEKREPKQVRAEANKTVALARKQAPDPTWKELQEAATALSRANKQSAKTVQRLADAVIAKARAVERKIEHERKIQEDEDDLIAVLLLAA
jgi:hypothetical protein